MSNRHLARTIAVQTLYQWDFNDQQKDVNEIMDDVKNSFAPEFDDAHFIDHLVLGVIDHKDEIDKLITKFAPEWPLDQITIVDRNILRLGTYELRFDETMPAKVAINESIELAKTFGGESSGKFVNGVLGAVYKDLGEKEIDKKNAQEKAKKSDKEPQDTAVENKEIDN
jgi:N utilization substance protein B